MQDQGSERKGYVSKAGSINELIPTLKEVKDAIQQLKSNKLTGKDGIGAGLFQISPEELVTCLRRLTIWL